LIQIFSLRAEHGYVLGASAAIYGLLAIAMVWAPRNDLNCWSFFRLVPVGVDVPIVVFAALYIGMEAVFVAFTDGAMSSALLHLTGALIGFAAGVVLLKLDIVDCENWDIFAVMQGRKGLSKGEATARQKRQGPPPSATPVKTRKRSNLREPETSGQDAAEAATKRLRRFLDERDVMSAHGAYDKAMRTVAGWQPANRDWLELIKGLLDAKESRVAISVMEDYLRRGESPSPRVRLRLAQMLIRENQRPAHALRVLAEIPPHSLPDDLEAHRVLLKLQAEQMRAEGVLELEGEVW
jgi:hypothetical protein